MSLVIYGKPDCPYCAKARAYYNENGVDFVEYDASTTSSVSVRCLSIPAEISLCRA